MVVSLGKREGEKFIVRRDGEEWRVVENGLREEQRENLMKVLKQDSRKMEIESPEPKQIKQKRRTR